MTKIRSTDEPVERMAKLMAALFTHLARELVSELGELDGTVAIRRAIKNFAAQRSESMLEEARERGLPLNAKTYAEVRDMPATGWIKDPDHPTDILFCPMAAMWQEMGDIRLARLYCEIDDHLLAPFRTKLDRPLCLTDGDNCCRFLLSAAQSFIDRHPRPGT